MRASLILAVLPDYRAQFVSELERISRDRSVEVQVYAGQSQLDDTVRSAYFEGVRTLSNVAFFGRRFLWQRGAIRATKGVDVVVADLNPRSLTAWLLLLLARLRGQRILLWGHVNPRGGLRSPTAPLRRFMRRLGDGVLSYTWNDASQVVEEGDSSPVWVVANGLYLRGQLGWNGSTARSRLVYVGRLEPAKKPMLMIEAFARVSSETRTGLRLSVVGDGSEKRRMSERARQLGVAEQVDFLGHVTDVERLRRIYDEAVASLSPGYVGLSLTQSLGFGVPMIVAKSDPHAPEIELLSEHTGITFASDDADALAAAIEDCVMAGPTRWDHARIVEIVAARYSATAMAEGLVSGLLGENGASDGG